MISTPVVLIGGGGHATVLLDILLKQGREVKAYVSPEPSLNKRMFAAIEWIKEDQEVCDLYMADQIELVNGIGSVPGNHLRKRVFNFFKSSGFRFAVIVDGSAVVSPFAELAEGVQVFPGAVINAGSRIACNSIVNTRAGVDHDCQIGEHNHIAPGVTLCGGVFTGESVYLGTGANVIQSVSVGSFSVVGAGATVTKSVGKNTIVYPARTTAKTICN